LELLINDVYWKIRFLDQFWTFFKNSRTFFGINYYRILHRLVSDFPLTKYWTSFMNDPLNNVIWISMFLKKFTNSFQKIIITSKWHKSKVLSAKNLISISSICEYLKKIFINPSGSEISRPSIGLVSNYLK